MTFLTQDIHMPFRPTPIKILGASSNLVEEAERCFSEELQTKLR